LAELARLCLSAVSEQAKPPVLAFGAMNLGENHGMAWVEMARGLLVHQLVFKGSQEGSVANVCRVLAPTEWNFHPQGVVASGLSGLSGHNGEEVAQRVGVLMAAFDPCVPFEIGVPDHSVEKEYQGA
jgi:Ni,Fe-hydrogenase I large subunit